MATQKEISNYANPCPKFGLMQVLVLLLGLTQVMELMMKKLSKIMIGNLPLPACELT